MGDGGPSRLYMADRKLLKFLTRVGQDSHLPYDSFLILSLAILLQPKHEQSMVR